MVMVVSSQRRLIDNHTRLVVNQVIICVASINSLWISPVLGMCLFGPMSMIGFFVHMELVSPVWMVESKLMNGEKSSLNMRSAV